jgi:hypothetical protein
MSGIRFPNLAEAMQAAAVWQRMKMANEQRERELDRAPVRAAAVQKYMSGEAPHELALVDPDLYDRFEARRQAQQKLETGQTQFEFEQALKARELGVEEQQLGRERSQRRGAQAAGLARALRVNPDAYSAARGALLGSGDWAPEELPEDRVGPRER